MSSSLYNHFVELNKFIWKGLLFLIVDSGAVLNELLLSLSISYSTIIHMNKKLLDSTKSTGGQYERCAEDRKIGRLSDFPYYPIQLWWEGLNALAQSKHPKIRGEILLSKHFKLERLNLHQISVIGNTGKILPNPEYVSQIFHWSSGVHHHHPPDAWKKSSIHDFFPFKDTPSLYKHSPCSSSFLKIIWQWFDSIYFLFNDTWSGVIRPGRLRSRESWR